MVSLALALILFPIFKWLSLLVFVSGVLIDVDHYLWYILKFNSFSLKKAYYHSLNHAERDPINEDVLHIFHVMEIWIPIFILGFFNKIFFILSIGLVVHLLMDFIECIRNNEYYARTFSLFTWVTRN